MSVTIDELQVEVQEGPSTPAPLRAPEPPPRALQLRPALEILRERELRLKAD